LSSVPIWIRTAVFLILLPGAIAGWIPWYVHTPHPDAPLIHQLGLPLVAVGWGVLLWCARDFARRGRGTPAPYDPPRALVTNGLYRFVRNPMYVGVLVAILGLALWWWSSSVLIYAVVVAIAFHLRVLIYEEPRLTRSFASDFAEYRARVPRWLPRLRQHGNANATLKPPTDKGS